MLGLAVESYSEEGTLNAPDVPGELVCLKAFPCMPAGFWPLAGFGTDEDVAGASAKYRQAYFAAIEGVWCESQLARHAFRAFSHHSWKTMAITLSSHVRGLATAGVLSCSAARMVCCTDVCSICRKWSSDLMLETPAAFALVPPSCTM